MDAMDAGFDQPASERRQGVARVDGDGGVLRPDPFPLALRVENLERGNRLTEEERDRAEVSVARRVQIADLLIVLGAARSIVHVPQVVLAFHIVLVVAHELVFVRELEEESEEA